MTKQLLVDMFEDIMVARAAFKGRLEGLLFDALMHGAKHLTPDTEEVEIKMLAKKLTEEYTES